MQNQCTGAYLYSRSPAPFSKWTIGWLPAASPDLPTVRGRGGEVHVRSAKMTVIFLARLIGCHCYCPPARAACQLWMCGLWPERSATGGTHRGHFPSIGKNYKHARFLDFYTILSAGGPKITGTDNNDQLRGQMQSGRLPNVWGELKSAHRPIDHVCETGPSASTSF